MGLGLIGDIAHGVGLRTLFLNRNSEEAASKDRNRCLSERRHYIVETLRGARQRVDGFEVGLFDERDPAALDGLASSGVQLVTISVGWEHIRELAALLLPPLDRRAALEDGSTLYVIACENIANGSGRLKDYMVQLAEASEPRRAAFAEAVVGRRIVFCDATVDRVCSRIQIKSGTVHVTAETYKKWLIERNTQTQPLEALLRGSEVVRFTDNIEAQEKLKLWAVNGLHLAIAVLARNHEPPIAFITEAVDAVALQPHIAAVWAEIREALLLSYPTEFLGPALDAFFEATLDRFREDTTDEVGRILKDLELTPDRVAKLVAEGLRRIRRGLQPNQESSAEVSVEVMEETLRWAIYTGAYVFVGKVNDRLGEPFSVLIQNDRSAKYLMAMFPQVIFLMDAQGRRLV